MSEPSPHTRRRGPLWAVGLVLATLLSWALTAPFASSVIPYEDSPVAGEPVPMAGARLFSSKEGFSSSVAGKHGVFGIPDVTKIEGPSVAIWGDSYIEAFQVDDKEKVAAQLTQLTDGTVTGVGIGRSGRSMADYVALIPRYEAVFKPRAHVVVLGSIDDVLVSTSGIYDTPPRLERAPFTAGSRSLRRWLHRLKLQFVWRVARNSVPRRSVRLRPGPTASKSPKADKYLVRAEPPSVALAQHIAQALRASTQLPVVVLYGPGVPRIINGEVVTEDLDADAVAVFEAACQREGIPFINLGPQFVAFWRETGRFPRGFANGQPSIGHWNAAGHRLAAKALLEALKRLEVLGAVHPG